MIPPSPPTRDILKTLFKPVVVGSVLTYGFVAFATIMLDEVFAIWAVEDVEDNGLAFSSSQVGIVLTYGGFVLLFGQVSLQKKSKKLQQQKD